MRLLIKGARCVDPQVGLDAVVDVLIEDGRIAELGEGLRAEGAQVLDADGMVCMPGFFDMHVHFRDPGQEYKETILGGCRSAAKGGFTDVATMPNTVPVCDTGAIVTYQLARAAEAGLARVHPIGALTKGEKGEALAEIGDMYHAGACAFSDDGHGVQYAGIMRTVMDYVSQFDRVVISHCQDDSLVGKGVVNEGVVSSRLGLAGWPAQGEEIHIERDIALAQLTGCSFHAAHVTTAAGARIVAAAKQRGLDVSCEVCPHHLFLCEDDITDDYDTNFKMSPPLRKASDAAALRQGILDGSIDCLVTDHAPHAKHEKDCEWEIAFFGCTGLETSLPLMITNMVSTGLMSWSRLVEVMAVNPRRLLRCTPVKIEAGSQADLTLIDPTRKVEVTESYFQGKSKNSAFLGATLTGCATDVLMAGKRTLNDGVVA